MELEAYFDPIHLSAAHPKASLGNHIHEYKDSLDLKGYDLAILNVPEYRWQTSSEVETDPSSVLDQLAGLFPNGSEPKVLNLGSLKLGQSITDTESALSEIIYELMNHRVVPIVLGGSRELTYAIYQSFAKYEEVVNITACDCRLNIEVDGEEGYIGRIVKAQPNYLFNFSNLGFQTYLVDPGEIRLAEELYFDAFRLGTLRGDVYATEPIIRSSEVFSFSMESVKNADFQSTLSPQPNGFYAEEACQMMRYAGLGEKLKVLLLTDATVNTSASDALLLAEMIWCFMDGYYARKTEIPTGKNNAFLKYRVSLKDDEFNLVFYKSLKTDRWWMEVPVPPQYANKYRKHHLIPCAYEDYRLASQDDLPDRWWKAYKKML